MCPQVQSDSDGPLVASGNTLVNRTWIQVRASCWMLTLHVPSQHNPSDRLPAVHSMPIMRRLGLLVDTLDANLQRYPSPY